MSCHPPPEADRVVPAAGCPFSIWANENRHVLEAMLRENHCLHWLARRGDTEGVEAVLAVHAERLVLARTSRGDIALMLAAMNGHAGVTKQLLEHQPEGQVAACDKHGNTALMIAAQNGRAEVAGLLLQHNPKAQVMTSGDVIAGHVRKSMGEHDVVFCI